MRAGLFICRLVTAIILFSSVFSFNSALAADWILTADDRQGLIAVPVDDSDGSHFFDMTRMTPGDSERAAVTIKNNCTFAFSLTVEVISLNEVSGGDLAEALIIEVYRNGVLLDGFPGIGKYTFADKFDPNTETVLAFAVSLPGSSTDDRFQDKEAALRWIFTADGAGSGGGGGSGGGIGNTRSGIPARKTDPLTMIDPLNIPLDVYEMPKTGEVSLWYSFAQGLTMLLLGALLFRKEKDISKYR